MSAIWKTNNDSDIPMIMDRRGKNSKAEKEVLEAHSANGVKFAQTISTAPASVRMGTGCRSGMV